MNVPRIASWCIVAALLALSTALGRNHAIALQQGTPGAGIEEGMEVLPRAPVHEDFAETVTFDSKPGLVTPTAPLAVKLWWPSTCQSKSASNNYA